MATSNIYNPGGNTNDIQYNNAGEFTGDANLQFNPQTREVTIKGNVVSNGYVKSKIYTNPYNFFLTGGNSGEVLTTDGTGNLSWTSPGNTSNNAIANFLPNYTGNIGAGNVNVTGGVYTFDISSTGYTSLTTLGVSANANINTLNVSNRANLGNISNVKIFGGNSGQTIITDGTGNLTFSNGYGNSNVASYLNTISIPYANQANVANAANFVAAGNVLGLGNIALTNFDGNASNVLYGNGSFAAKPSSYSNSNVSVFLANFGSNTIVTTGDISTGNIKTDNILYANGVPWNFGSSYSNSNVANYLPSYDGDLSPTNIHVTTTSLLGDNATANSYYVYRDSNQVSLGQLGANTIDINSSGIAITADTKGWTFDTDGNITLPEGGDILDSNGESVLGNSVVFTGVDQPNTSVEGTLWFNSDIGKTYVKYDGQWVDSNPQTIDARALRTNLDDDVEIPKHTIYTNGRMYQDVSEGMSSIRWVNVKGTSDMELLRAYRSGFENDDETGEVGQIGVKIQDSNLGGVYIKGFNGEDEITWTFDGTGNITFPDDTVQTTAFQPATLLDGGGANSTYTGNYQPGSIPNPFDQELNTNDIVQFANVTAGYFIGDGSQLTNIPTSNANTGNVTFSNQTVIGTGDVYGGGGLYLALGPDSVADLQYFRVRGGDNPTHLHFDTGNNEYFDQYFGDDGKYVKLEPGSSGNVVIGTNNNTWTFDNAGNLTLPSNTSAINYANGSSYVGNIASINLDGSSSNVLYGNGVFASVSLPNVTTDNFRINGEGKGLIVDAGDLKRFGFMKYYGIEGSLVHSAATGNAVPLRIGRTSTQDVTAANVDTFTTEIYVGTNGYVRIADDNVNNINDPTERLEVTGNIKTTGNLIASTNVLSNGYGKFSGSFDESIGSNTGVVLGYAGGTPRVLFGTGNTLQTFEIDNDGGNLRFYQPGSTKATLTSSGNFTVSGSISATNIGNISAINLDDSSSNVLYGNGVFAPAAGGSSYSNSNVSTFLSSFGSNTITTTGNVTAGNLAFGSNSGQLNFATGAFISGNANSLTRDGSILLQPYTGAGSTFPGVIIGGAGRLIAPNGGVFQIFNSSDVTFQATIKSTLSTAATSTITGALIIPGGAGLAGSITTGVGALLTGPTFTPLANTVAGFNSNVNSYTQVTFQNKSTGADATADIVLTADNGNDTTNYGDFGIINSGYDNNTPTNSLGNIVFAADTYLYAQGNVSNASQSGGNLAIGTTVPGKNVKIFAGGANSNSIIANISNTGVNVTGNLNATGTITANNFSGNITGTSPNVTLIAGSYSYIFDNGGTLTLPTGITGNEGGEIAFTQAANSTLAGNTVILDQYADRIRFFEGGGNARGVYIDLTQAADGVNTLLNNRVSGLVNAGTFITMDLIKATVTTTGNRGLSLAATTGSFSILIAGNYATSGGANGSSGSATITTTPSGSQFNWNFLSAGDIATYIITDTTNSRTYRITLQIGASYNNNMISIERLL